MGFGANWKDEASKQWDGETLFVRFSVRLPDDTLLEVTDEEAWKDMNPIVREREKDFGRAQGQVSSLRVMNEQLTLMMQEIERRPAVIEVGFPERDEWETIAQGKIRKMTSDTNLTCLVEIKDVVAELMGKALQRDIKFQDTGWAGNIHVESKASGSSNYNNDYDNDGIDEGVTVHTSANVRDETYVIEFTAATVYQVTCEGGTPQTGKSIASDENITSQGSSGTAVTIETEGWDQTSGAYATGDKFVFYTAQARTTAELSPIHLVRHLIEDVGGIEVYDVLTGANYSSPCYDTANWDAMAALVTASRIEGGPFRAGTRLSTLISHARKSVHAEIYPTCTGQIGLWMVKPGITIGVELNADPESGDVQIVEGRREHDADSVVNEVTIEYKTLDGEDASITVNDDTSPYDDTLSRTIKIDWWLDGGTALDCANKYLNRYKRVPKGFWLRTTLAGGVVDMTESAAITAAVLNAAAEVSQPTKITINPNNNTAELVTALDPVALADYAIVGDATTDPVGSTVGGSQVVF